MLWLLFHDACGVGSRCGLTTAPRRHFAYCYVAQINCDSQQRQHSVTMVWWSDWLRGSKSATQKEDCPLATNLGNSVLQPPHLILVSPQFALRPAIDLPQRITAVARYDPGGAWYQHMLVTATVLRRDSDPFPPICVEMTGPGSCSWITSQRDAARA